MPLTIINAAGVRKLLPMDECIDAMLAVRPVDEIIVWGRNPDKAQAFAQAQRTGIRVRATADPADRTANRSHSTSHTESTPRIYMQQNTSMQNRRKRAKL